MVLTTKNIKSLIENPEGNMAEQSKVICKVLRPFFYEGKKLDAGKTIELPQNFAREMKEANKVEINSGGSDSKSEAVDPMDTVKSGKK